MDETRGAHPGAAMTSVGETLRVAREAQGLSIGEVAERTRVPSRHLAAIETGQHQGLPAATYSSGFVKTYARLLGLDGQDLAQRFRTELSHTAPRSFRQDIYEPADPARTPGRGIAWISLAVVVLVVLGYLYWRGTHREDAVSVAAAASDTPPPAPAQAPAASPVAPVPATVDATSPVVLTADSPVWLRITDTGGAKLFEGMLDSGKSFTVPATAADPRLLTGRPNALKVTVGNTAIPPLGPPEQRVRDVSLKAADLIAHASAVGPTTPDAASAGATPLVPASGATPPADGPAEPN